MENITEFRWYNRILKLVLSILFMLSFNLSNAQSSKKGVCMITTRTDGKWIYQIQQLNAKSHYRWDLKLDPNEPEGIPYVPMIVGRPAPTQADFDYLNTNKSSFTHLLGYNEPDAPPGKQGHMSVDSALMFWPKLMENGLILGSPAGTNALGSWMKQFMTSVQQKNYRVDFVPIHWYGPPSVSTFLNHVKAVHNEYHKPVWITEFSPADGDSDKAAGIVNKYTEAQSFSFMKAVLDSLENPNYSFVQRYFWFSNSPPDDWSLGRSSLYDYDGALTPIGQYYSNFKEINTKTPTVNPLVAWNVFNQSQSGLQGLAPKTLNSSLESVGFTKGNGITMLTANNNLWGATGWSLDKTKINTAIADSQFVEFSISPKQGKVLSLSKIGDFKIIISSTGPIYYRLQYAINEGEYKGITTWSVNRPSTTTVFQLENIDLSFLPDLQNIPYGKTIKFRLIPYNATSSAGQFYFGNRLDENCLAIEGNIKSFESSGTTTAVDLASWNFKDEVLNGRQNMLPTLLNSALVATGLTKGSGIKTDEITYSKVWGGRAWHTSASKPGFSIIDSAVRNRKYLTFSFQTQADKLVSFTEINPFIAMISRLGPDEYTIQYALNSDYKDIATLTIPLVRTAGTATKAFTFPNVDLSGISELQNIAPGRSINFRIVPYGATDASYGQFYLGDNLSNGISFGFKGFVSTLLPVKLSSFSAKRRNEFVDIQWTTSSEMNFNHFILERKQGSGDFEEIYRANSSGFSTGGKYSFTDEFKSFDTQYYRLKMVDNDGTIVYSYIIAQQPIVGAEDQSISLYPNPAISEVTVSYPPATANSLLRIYGTDGKLYAEYPLLKESIFKKVDVSNLKSGYYIVIYNNSSTSKSLKFIKN
ncbi:T9SS type A sorting domain-containing protein [Pedobacter sp. SD-b]|uniref:T9SS type A sorting domain-containing protein n=1 Tax=Pedobacter segetis TaxID=2793069 RepID=A0ABS1BL25_9SPHI|nr:glycosyl hydrolase [Pedobacter segetis]MBK0383572.1 T9SS type A sorting domain-containing protein [Pedobacter segetis]